MKPRAITFSEKTIKELEATGRQRGFASASAFIRYAVKQELGGHEEGLTGAEERLAASIEQVRKEVFRHGRAHQALFAYLDTLAKAVAQAVASFRAIGRGGFRGRSRNSFSSSLGIAQEVLHCNPRLADHGPASALE